MVINKKKSGQNGGGPSDFNFDFDLDPGTFFPSFDGIFWCILIIKYGTFAWRFLPDEHDGSFVSGFEEKGPDSDPAK